MSDVVRPGRVFPGKRAAAADVALKGNHGVVRMAREGTRGPFRGPCLARFGHPATPQRTDKLVECRTCKMIGAAQTVC